MSLFPLFSLPLSPSFPLFFLPLSPSFPPSSPSLPSAPPPPPPSFLTQSLAAGLKALLQYEGDVAEDFCYTFQVSMPTVWLTCGMDPFPF